MTMDKNPSMISQNNEDESDDFSFKELGSRVSDLHSIYNLENWNGFRKNQDK
jgi:hypothetical protein